MSRFLQMFNYDVTQASCFEQAEVALHGVTPDFLIVDAQIAEKHHLQSLRGTLANHRQYTFLFLLVESSDEDRLAEALEAGVDDFLAKPMVYGELLARLRAAARSLEYERRVREQSAIEQITGLLSEQAFRQRVESELQVAGPAETLACAVLDIDFMDCLVAQHGVAIGDQLMIGMADTMRAHGQLCKYQASFRHGKFAVLLSNMSDAKALAWAEELRHEIAERQIDHANTPLSFTVSIGIATADPGEMVSEQLVGAAEKALASAKNSGRNCVARNGQFDGETREWEDLATTGRLFESTTARDVMTTIPFTFAADDPLTQAASLLQQTKMGEVPVVNSHGKLIGLVQADGLLTMPADAASAVREVMTSKPDTFDEDTTFQNLMDHFADSSSPVAVIVRKDRPVGLVHRRILASLCDPLSTTTFAPDSPFSNTSEYLLVGDAGHVES